MDAVLFGVWRYCPIVSGLALEIYYIIHNGLEEGDNTSMNFVEQLEENIGVFKKRIHNFETTQAIYAFINIAAFTAVGGTLIYVIFNYFL